jgi:hypothetical protein
MRTTDPEACTERQDTEQQETEQQDSDICHEAP